MQLFTETPLKEEQVITRLNSTLFAFCLCKNECLFIPISNWRVCLELLGNSYKF